MNFDGDTVTHPYLQQPGGIRLPPANREKTRGRDLRFAAGLGRTILFVGNAIVWTFVIVQLRAFFA